jgi:hypothetical protein
MRLLTRMNCFGMIMSCQVCILDVELSAAITKESCT